MRLPDLPASSEPVAATQENEEEYSLNSSSSSSLHSRDKALPERPYHVFTRAKKKELVYIVSLAGLFSPLSSNIYFPALGQIAIVSLVSLSSPVEAC